MVIRRMRFWVLFTTYIALSLPCSYAEGYPAHIAEQYNCKEIVGFHDAPVKNSPSFLYGFKQDAETSDSVIFWCRSSSDVDVFKLIAHVKNDGLTKCSGVVYETKNFPGGLSLVHAQNEALVGYRKVSNGEKVSPSAYQGILIKSFYDGAGYTFVCSDSH